MKLTKKTTKEMTSDELEQVAGGSVYPDYNTYQPYIPNDPCKCPNNHADKYLTGLEREAEYLFFFSNHQVQYHCPTCGYDWWENT